MCVSSFLRLRSINRFTTPAIMIAILSAGMTVLRIKPGGDPVGAPAVSSIDARFVPLGRAYVPALGRVYAAAWIDGARALEAGQPVDTALQTVSKSWDSRRAALFDRLVTPQFSRILPEGQANADSKPADKQALARAWRGFARGLDPQAK
jgi:hypothetical protein